MKQTNEKGFTLIELLVVILIIAILAAVGIVALLGAIRAGQDSAAKQTLTKVGTEIRAQDVEGLFEQTGTLTAEQLVTTLNSVSPDFTWQATAISGDPTNVVTVDGLEDDLLRNVVVFGTRSKSGKCLYIYVRPFSNIRDEGAIVKSNIQMISKEKYDTCATFPVVAAAGGGPDMSVYEIY
jgi:prepilin-type N-terminal cleavage/methylation domain-containing protein